MSTHAYKLYSDDDTFQREYPATYRLSDVMAAEGINSRARVVAHEGRAKTYRVDGSGYHFTIREA